MNRLLLALTLLLPVTSIPASPVDPEIATVRAFKEVANDMCIQPAAYGVSRKVTGGVVGRIDASKIVSKVVKLGGSADFRSSKESWSGVLQSDLCATIRDANACRRVVFIHMLDMHKQAQSARLRRSTSQADLAPNKLAFSAPFNQGRLTPAQDPDPVSRCSVGAGQVGVFLGSNIFLSNADRMVVLRSGGVELLTVTKMGSSIQIDTLRVFDDRDDNIVRVEPKGFWVTPAIRFANPDPHTLIVYDHLDNEVLRLRYLNQNAIRVTGLFRYPGMTPVIITEDAFQVAGLHSYGSCFHNTNGINIDGKRIQL